MFQAGKASVLAVVGVVLMTSATTATALGRRAKEREGRRESVVLQSSERPAAKAEPSPTFLDTLNRGREAALTARDIAAVAITLPVRDEPAVARTVFRIQCMASSRIEPVRVEKAALLRQVSLPVSIVFADPYYKLMAGDFDSRAEADEALLNIKGLGYGDAWVVKSAAGDGE